MDTQGLRIVHAHKIPDDTVLILYFVENSAGGAFRILAQKISGPAVNAVVQAFIVHKGGHTQQGGVIDRPETGLGRTLLSGIRQQGVVKNQALGKTLHIGVPIGDRTSPAGIAAHPVAAAAVVPHRHHQRHPILRMVGQHNRAARLHHQRQRAVVPVTEKKRPLLVAYLPLEQQIGACVPVKIHPMETGKQGFRLHRGVFHALAHCRHSHGPTGRFLQRNLRAIHIPFLQVGIVREKLGLSRHKRYGKQQNCSKKRLLHHVYI